MAANAIGRKRSDGNSGSELKGCLQKRGVLVYAATLRTVTSHDQSVRLIMRACGGASRGKGARNRTSVNFDAGTVGVAHTLRAARVAHGLVGNLAGAIDARVLRDARVCGGRASDTGARVRARRHGRALYEARRSPG